jgi:hypothetical protein
VLIWAVCEEEGFEVALCGQIRFNAGGDIPRRENHEETICVFGGRLFDTGFDGRAGLGSDEQSFTAESAGESHM